MTLKKEALPLKLILVAGARPNFMKISPLIKAIRAHNRGRKGRRRVAYRLVHTGQHYDNNMSEIFFKELSIPAPHVNLKVGSGSHAEQTARIMIEFEPVCLREKPDWVVVVGDVNSTMACTLVASKLRIKVAHVEAGLRSFDRTMPEEVNRVVTDALADLLLTPSSDANKNLTHEGIPPAKIRLVGNIMIDTLVESFEKAKRSQLPRRFGLRPKRFVYVTLHRPSNVDDQTNLTALLRELTDLSNHLRVVFPVHPRTRKMLAEYGISIEGHRDLILLDPVGYHDSLWLTKNAMFVLTDSGGLQEESTYFRTPCLTLRPNTERPITITLGTNKLTRHETLAADIEEILQRRRPRGRIPKFWDGRTAERILKLLLRD
jgi:UDP-N-acetylglucosamine 2-epimerase (non-hydrolysing)